jgi:predicted amidophosphoribosyltransferase
VFFYVYSDFFFAYILLALGFVFEVAMRDDQGRELTTGKCGSCKETRNTLFKGFCSQCRFSFGVARGRERRLRGRQIPNIKVPANLKYDGGISGEPRLVKTITVTELDKLPTALTPEEKKEPYGG